MCCKAAIHIIMVILAVFLCNLKTQVQSCTDNVNKTDRYTRGYYERHFFGDKWIPPRLIEIIVHNITITCSSVKFPLSFQSKWSCNCPRKLELRLSNLVTIPPQAFIGISTSTILVLKNLGIQVLSPSAFGGHPFEQIDLSVNKIREISEGVFSSLKDLKFLDLSANNVEILSSRAFSGALNLKVLNLHNNKLKNFNNNVFYRNILIDFLDLRQNRLEYISLDLYVKIKVIRIDNNRLSDMQFCPFDFNELHSSNNLLKNINTSKCTKKSYAISTIDLNSNNITKLDAFVFEKTPDLRNLYLSSNNITCISTSSFNHLNNLEYLDLSQNGLNRFEYGTFDHLENLIRLNLSNNKIDNIDNTLHALKSLQTLSIENNNITLLNPMKISSYSPKLQRISFFNNHLTCENLIYINAFFKQKSVLIMYDDKRNTTNVHGIACRKEAVTESPENEHFLQLNNNLKNISALLNRLINHNTQFTSQLSDALVKNKENDKKFSEDFDLFVKSYATKNEDGNKTQMKLQNITELLHLLISNNVQQADLSQVNLRKIFDVFVDKYNLSTSEEIDAIKVGLQNINSVLNSSTNYEHKNLIQNSLRNISENFRNGINKLLNNSMKYEKNFTEIFNIFKDFQNSSVIKDKNTAVNFELFKNSLTNITNYFEQFTENEKNASENTAQKYINNTDLALKTLEIYQLNLSNITSGIHELFSEIKGSNSLESDAKFEKLTSLQGPSSDKVVIVLGIILIILMFLNCLFMFYFVFKSVQNKCINQQEQLELL